MALPKLKFNVNDVKTFYHQLVKKDDDKTPVNITGFTLRWYAKDKAGDAAYTIGPVTATITDAANGLFQFDDVTMPATKTNSVYWIETVGVDTFQPAEGTQIQVLDK